MGLELMRPSKKLEAQALDYRKEHFDHNEKIINGSELFDKIEAYDTWQKAVTDNADPDTVSPDWVLTDTFFAVETETKQIVGIIDLRHELKGFLVDFGNCGYSVRPTQRRKGYATEMLRQIKEVAVQAGMKELRLSVECSNVPSIKTIEKNGGIYERSFDFEGECAKIYVIQL